MPIPDDRQQEHTRLVFFGPLSLRTDDNAKIEQGLLHSEGLQQIFPRPPKRTLRYKWLDARKGAVPDGSEYCIVKSPPPPEDYSQGELFYSGIRGMFSETKTGTTAKDRESERRTLKVRSIIMVAGILLLIVTVLMLVVMPWASGGKATDDAPSGGRVESVETVEAEAGGEAAGATSAGVAEETGTGTAGGAEADGATGGEGGEAPQQTLP